MEEAEVLGTEGHSQLEGLRAACGQPHAIGERQMRGDSKKATGCPGWGRDAQAGHRISRAVRLLCMRGGHVSL